MTGSVLYPRLGLAIRERDRDERGARVGAFEEDSAIDAGGNEVLAVLRGGVVDVDLFAVKVDEDEVVILGGDAVVGKENAPCTQGSRDAG